MTTGKLLNIGIAVVTLALLAMIGTSLGSRLPRGPVPASASAGDSARAEATGTPRSPQTQGAAQGRVREMATRFFKDYEEVGSYGIRDRWGGYWTNNIRSALEDDWWKAQDIPAQVRAAKVQNVAAKPGHPGGIALGLMDVLMQSGEWRSEEYALFLEDEHKVIGFVYGDKYTGNADGWADVAMGVR